MVKDSEGYIFELQCHTPESLSVKDLDHKLSEEQRLLSTTAQRTQGLGYKMMQNSNTMPMPDSADKIKDIK